MTTTSTSSANFKITLMDDSLDLDSNDKLMLSDFDYFRTMFTGGFSESKDNCATYKEIKLKDFKYFLAYVALKKNNDAAKYLKSSRQVRFTRFFENPFLFVDVKIASRLYPTAHQFNVDLSDLCNPSFKHYIQNLGHVTEEDIATLKELASINIGLQSTILTKIPDQRIADFLEVLDLGTEEIDRKVAPYAIDNPTKSTELRHLSLDLPKKCEWLTKLDRLNLKTLHVVENNQSLTFLTSQTALTSLRLLYDRYTHSFDPQLSILTRLRSLEIDYCVLITSLSSLVIFDSLQIIKICGYDAQIVSDRPSLDLLNLDTDPFSQLTALHTLKITNCNIRQLNVHDLLQLRNLRLRTLGLTSLNMLNLPSLESLSLEIYKLPFYHLPELPSLKAIYAKQFEIQLLGGFQNTPNLEMIKLRLCKNLTELEESFTNLSRLTKLSIKHCQRVNLPPIPTSLTYLKILEMPSLESLTRLTNLQTIKTHISNFAGNLNALSQFTHLRSLRLFNICSENPLTNLENLPLDSVSLSFFRFYKSTLLPSTLKTAEFDLLSPNGFLALSKLTNLQTLNLVRSFDVTDLKPLERLPLKSLRLEMVGVTNLESAPASLTSLQIFICRSLTNLDRLSNLTKLVSLRYDDHNQLFIGNLSFGHIMNGMGTKYYRSNY